MPYHHQEKYNRDIFGWVDINFDVVDGVCKKDRLARLASRSVVTTSSSHAGTDDILSRDHILYRMNRPRKFDNFLDSKQTYVRNNFHGREIVNI